jgi:hypothetical protein
MTDCANSKGRSDDMAAIPLRHSAHPAYRDCVGRSPVLGAMGSGFSLRPLRPTAPQEAGGAVSITQRQQLRDDHELHIRVDLIPSRGGVPCR